MSAPEQVQVTQADRDAAVGILRLSLSNSDERAMMIAEGSLDLDPVVQAFARHRYTAQSDALAVMREAIDTVVECGFVVGCCAMSKTDGHELAALIVEQIKTAAIEAIDQMGGG